MIICGDKIHKSVIPVFYGLQLWVLQSTLSISLLIEALETIAHILNRVFIKSISKIVYGLWTRSKPSLNHLYVWGCLVKVKIFNLDIRKLDSNTLSCYFITYLER
jgi:hypothetical protein